ncbi:MAG: acyl-CoA dehydratase activase [Phycisphaerae bacterium]|nr:acyl-CoA dehydratase activase [Phycisphaerae bacterium]
MSCYIGIDIGAVSVTAGLWTDDASWSAPKGWTSSGSSAGNGQGAMWLSPYRRTRGHPLAATCELLEEILSTTGAEDITAICMTGSGSSLAADKLNTHRMNEFQAIASGLKSVGASVSTVFEMGGETSKYLRLARETDNGTLSIIDYATNGDCAAGTGSFLDQQAGRLQYAIEDVAELVAQAQRSAQVAGRCSVFAKSDMIHAQQKGYCPAEVLGGLCDAVARNFRAAVVRSHAVTAPVVMIGGVASNAAVVKSLRDAFDLGQEELVVPEAHRHIPAIGAACAARRMGAKAPNLSALADIHRSGDTAGVKFPTTAPLSMENVLLLRDRIGSYVGANTTVPINAYLGIDIGSVSTNVVVIDEAGRVITEIYTKTMGRPIEVVADALSQIEKQWGDSLTISGVGTTGSGRELIGELVGADTVNDEITAHKTGALFVGKTMLSGQLPDTIFEIGGQDAKYISLQDGVVVDFTMNEACAAGTGSFLEERAEELDIAIKQQFAEMALSSKAPIRLGERCTVFMERDVNSYMQRGADKSDLVAGLACSVVYNYINRVVRGRHIGECIFFQGGTAYNDAVAAAFAAVTGKQIIVPPHNGVIGAIGAALLASEKMKHTRQPAESQFRGYDMSKVDYSLREFTCNHCSNACQIQEFNVEGNKTYWGDKCSERFRRRAVRPQEPVTEDLMGLRRELLTDDSNIDQAPAGAPVVGIPMAMFAHGQLPFWRTLLSKLGFATVLSTPTNKETEQAGQDAVVAEPCFPIVVAHGHIACLDRPDIDHILVPNIISAEEMQCDMEIHLCPWHQTLPFVARSAPALEAAARKFISPQVHFSDGQAAVTRELVRFFRSMGLKRSKIRSASAAAFEAQADFKQKCLTAGAKALETLKQTGRRGVVLVGRPYNLHDPGVNLSVARKLRQFYGVDCIPQDFLPTHNVDISEVNANMFWSLGRHVLAAAKIVGENPNLDIIYITNFKCGPDSFVKHFTRPAAGKPFLTLQFDGHSNDAGIMTRCEAYLDSKGILRPRATKPQPKPRAVAT